MGTSNLIIAEGVSVNLSLAIEACAMHVSVFSGGSLHCYPRAEHAVLNYKPLDGDQRRHVGLNRTAKEEVIHRNLRCGDAFYGAAMERDHAVHAPMCVRTVNGDYRRPHRSCKSPHKNHCTGEDQAVGGIRGRPMFFWSHRNLYGRRRGRSRCLYYSLLSFSRMLREMYVGRFLLCV